jgi:hypothetical protein
MTGPNLPEIDVELQHEARICKEGVKSDFWKYARRRLLKLKDEAKDGLVTVDPTDLGVVAQLQKTAQVVDTIIADVEGTASLI